MSINFIMVTNIIVFKTIWLLFNLQKDLLDIIHAIDKEKLRSKFYFYLATVYINQTEAASFNKASIN